MAKHIQTKQISITELCVGMYVTQLQVPWSATSFPLEGVMVKCHKDIVALSQYGNTLHIDQAKSLTTGEPSLSSQVSIQTGNLIGLKQSRKKPRSWRKFCTRQYQTKQPLAKEMHNAVKLFNRIGVIFAALRRDPELNRVKNSRELEAVSEAIVDSILSNPDALIWLSKVKSCGGLVYDHTLRTAIWATLIGRSMGLLKSALHQLNEAILLSGVGKLYLKKADWQGCDNPQIESRYARWSTIATKKLCHSKIEPSVLTIMANMTERYDGSGFPNQKQGRAIPYLSQIAAIAEAFELSMNPILKKTKRTAGQSLCRLYWCRDELFDGDIVDELIQAVGLYPAGSQVELTNCEKGIVIEQSQNKRIQPALLLTHDDRGKVRKKPKVVNLGEGLYEEVIIYQESPFETPTNEFYSRVNKSVMSHHYGWFMSTYYRMTGLFH